MKKKTNAIICAICTFFAIIFITGLSTTTSAYAETEIQSSCIIDMVNANDGSIFLVGNSNDAELPTASEAVVACKEILLTSSVYARNNSEMSVNDNTRLEFVNQFGYCDEQTITVSEDVVSYEAKLMFERPEKNGRIGYTIYSFDRVYNYETAEKAGDKVAEFNYRGFRYQIFVQDEQFCLAKKWDPEENSHVYECVDKNDYGALIRKLKEAFTVGKDIEFIEECEIGYVKIHAFVNNGGQKEEFIFYSYNGRPVNERTEIIASVDTVDDTYTIYATDGSVAIDSAKRSASIDFPKSKLK